MSSHQLQRENDHFAIPTDDKQTISKMRSACSGDSKRLAASRQAIAESRELMTRIDELFINREEHFA